MLLLQLLEIMKVFDHKLFDLPDHVVLDKWLTHTHSISNTVFYRIYLSHWH